MIIRDLGTIDFHEAYALQERLVAGVAAGTEPETLLLLEHPSVYTLGSGGREENVLDRSVRAVRINRGGPGSGPRRGSWRPSVSASVAG